MQFSIFEAMRNVLFLLLILASATVSHSQKPVDTRGWEVNGQFGFLAVHRPEIAGLPQKHIRGLSVKRLWQTSGNLKWHKTYNYPKIGLDLSYFDLGNPDVLGRQLSLSSFLHIHLGRNSPLYLEPAIGLGYSTKHWNRENNIKNLTLGTAFNGSVALSFGLEKAVWKQFSLVTGLRFSHQSNGAFSFPNLGTNIVSGYAGIRMQRNERFHNPKFDNNNDLKDHIGRARHQFAAVLTAGLREARDKGSTKYPAAGLSLFYKERTWEKGFWLVGTDVLYNQAAAVGKAVYREGELVDAANPMRAGVKAGIGMVLDALTLHLETGVYVLDPIKNDGAIYNRLQLSYHFGPAFYGTFGLKSHLARADHFELGLGYRIFTSNAQI